MLGLDEIERLKGLPLKLLAFEQLLMSNPGLAGTTTYVQIGVGARNFTPAAQADYDEVRDEMTSPSLSPPPPPPPPPAPPPPHHRRRHDYDRRGHQVRDEIMEVMARLERNFPGAAIFEEVRSAHGLHTISARDLGT